MISLVTGGAGFIGSHIVERLLDEGHHVRVLDNFSTGKAENLAEHSRLEIITGDVGDYDTALQATRGVHYIFHKAAIASVPQSINDPLGTQRTNYQGTLNVLEAARQNNVRRVVFSSSAAAYGDHSTPPLTEEMPNKPLSPYAVDKVASEYACQVYWKLYGLETVCLRYFNVYGPRQDPSSPYSGVISIFLDKLHLKLPPVIYGDGNQTRDFIYVADVVEANLKAATSDPATGEVFNIATGQPTSLNALLETLSTISGQRIGPMLKPAREGDIRHSVANIQKSTSILKWTSTVTLNTGLKKLLENEHTMRTNRAPKHRYTAANTLPRPYTIR